MLGLNILNRMTEFGMPESVAVVVATPIELRGAVRQFETFLWSSIAVQKRS
jgi:hypothetical protein